MISDFYPPFLGGSFRYVQILSKALVERGNEVIVATIGNNELKGFEDDCGVKVFRFFGLMQQLPILFKDRNMKYPPPIPDPIAIIKIKKLILEEKPDIVHCHGWLLYSVLVLKRVLLFPLVVTLHDYGYMCPKITLFKNNKICSRPFTYRCLTCAGAKLGLAKSALTYFGLKLGRDRLFLADEYISNSYFVKEKCEKYLKIKNKVSVIQNFLAIKQNYSNLLNSEEIPDDFILFVGSLAPYKGVEVLIDAFKKLKTKTKLVLLGATSPEFSYKSIGNIIVIKNASPSQVLEAYSKCKFVVIPSIWPEPFGLVALEAMSYKKAIIASDIGGLREVIKNKRTGLLIQPNNSNVLIQAMQLLLSNPDIAKKMGIRGRNRLEEFYSQTVVIPKLERIYQKLLLKSKCILV